MRAKREKTFGLPARKLMAADRGRMWQLAHDYNAANRQPRQHNGPLTHATLLVLHALLFTFHHRETGECFPSYEAIAERSGVHRSTVADALRALEVAGVLTWSHRLGRVRRRVQDTLTGKLVWVQQVVRRSNAYVFHMAPALARRALSQETSQERKQATSPEMCKSGNAAGPNCTSIFVSKEANGAPNRDVGDALEAALRHLGNAIQARAATG